MSPGQKEIGVGGRAKSAESVNRENDDINKSKNLTNAQQKF